MQGADCAGLMGLIYEQERGIVLPDYSELYENTTDHAVLSRVINAERESRWVDVEFPQEFDAIILRIRNVPMHVGVVTRKNHMIHCSRGTGTVHERFDHMRWKDKIIGFSRWVS